MHAGTKRTSFQHDVLEVGFQTKRDKYNSLLFIPLIIGSINNLAIAQTVVLDLVARPI